VRRWARVAGATAIGLGVLVSAVPAGAAPVTDAARAASGAVALAPGPSDAPEYWFDQWKVPQLWAAGASGAGVTIAEIDTGVNAALPELAGRILPGTDFGQPGDGRVDREIDQFGHGTAMASIMVAARGTFGVTGLAPGAKVLPIAVPLTGTTDAQTDDYLGPAIRWAADHDAKIISMSLGGARNPSRNSAPCPADEQAAVYYALGKGALVFAASGNRGTSGSPVEEPGVCLGVVSVGAVDGTGQAAPFSSRHPYLTLTAPGVNVASLSRVPGAVYAGDGTSQATAIACAAVALVWSKFPSDSGRQILARVLATLDRRSATRDPAYGYGTINAYTAVTAAVAADAPNPVFAAADPFMARAAAFQQQPVLSPPAPAAYPATGTGMFSVGDAPRLLVPRVLEGLALAGVGLLSLLVLAIGARSRRRRTATTGQADAQAPSPFTIDDTGLVWHEIIGPNNPPRS
jgi:subtilisin family serine protease